MAAKREMDYYDILQKEFESESDRAAVIVAASMLDELLRTLLMARLIPVSSATDELFDGANAPLGTFSSRIEMAYRIGVVSVKFARDLHLVRRIRNDFAHNIHGCSFEDTRVRSRVIELDNSNGILARSPKAAAAKKTMREHFFEGVSWMIFHLENQSSEVHALEACEEEWGYTYCQDEPPEPPPPPPKALISKGSKPDV